MRRVVIQLLYGFVSLILMSTTAFAGSNVGWDDGNAGDPYVSEFKLTARDIIQRLELIFPNGVAIPELNALKAALATTKVTSSVTVELNGQDVAAKNYPKERLIEVSQTRWILMRRASMTRPRMRVVLHEYLWVGGVDDTDYVASDRLLSLLNPKDFNPNTWWKPVNPLNYVVPKLSYAPEGCEMEAGRFDVKQSFQVVTLESQGPCGEAYRRLEIVKETALTPASSNVRGEFHTYDIGIFDQSGAKIAAMKFEPEWGECLLPQAGSCRVSGKMTLGGVELVFCFLENNLKERR